ncbi:hypothetical protein AGMMS49965_03390 [Bacteroidia bacterium]|nr:hypothetical protein AGMMS49965_03390 [Bacteroidia bacterium]
MKKYVLLVAAMVVGTVSASAQFFVGGSLDYRSYGLSSTSSLSFVPKVGYVISDKLEVGAHISYESNDEVQDVLDDYGFPKMDSDGQTQTTTVSVSTTGFGAFGRYKFLESDKLSLWGQATLGMKSPEGMSILSLSAVPVVKYALTGKINLTSTVNLLHFSYTSTSVSGGGASFSDITLGAGGAAPIAIGIEYKF